jgi:hypothetical protein
MERSVLALGPNVHVAYVDFYGDRVLHAWIQNDQDRGTEVCLDLRKDSPTCNRLFEGGRYPHKEGAVLVELGSEQEGIVIPLLSCWLDSDRPRKELTEFGIELFQTALLRYGDIDESKLTAE